MYNEVWAAKIVDVFMDPFLIAMRNGWKGWPDIILRREEIIKRVADPSKASQEVWREYKKAWKKCGHFLLKNIRAR